jgi:SulP family sulfate permease
MPVSSSGSRTVIGDSLGSRSQLYSLVAVAMVVLTLLFLGPLLELFPRAALAALVIWAAIKLVDVAELRRIGRFRRSELVLALATTAAVLVFDIVYGVLVAIGLSVVDLIRRVARPHDGVLGFVPGKAGMHDIDDYSDARQVPGLMVYRYDSPLFFANAENFHERALASLDNAEGPVEWVLLNFEANVHVDLTSVDALAALHDELAGRGITLALARVKHEMYGELERSGLIDEVGRDHVFPTLPTAVVAYFAAYERKHGHPPDGVLPPDPPAQPSFGRPSGGTTGGG